MSTAAATEYAFASAPLGSGEIQLTLHEGLLSSPSAHQRMVSRVRPGDPPQVDVIGDAVIGEAVLGDSARGRVGDGASALFTSVQGVFHVGDSADRLADAVASLVAGGARDARAHLSSIDRARDRAVFSFEATAQVPHHDAAIPVRGDITIDRNVRRVEGRISGRVDGAQLTVELSASR